MVASSFKLLILTGCGQGFQLDSFHVDQPPTRAAWMTGHSNRVGVWHTVQGRNLLRSREVTMADIFSDNVLATGIFGKWHLGDTYPFRPEEGLVHRLSWRGLVKLQTIGAMIISTILI